MNQPDHQRTWTVAEAQTQLTEILRLAAEEGPQYIGADRPFVLLPAETWKAKEQPHNQSQRQGRKPMGQWLLQYMPRAVDLELPSRDEPERPIPFVTEAGG